MSESKFVCPKCGHDDLSVKYHRGAHPVVGKPDSEWLGVTCKRCCYSFQRDTLDAVKAGTP